MLHALETFARLCKTFYRDSFEQNHVVRSLLGPSYKLRQLVVKKDAIPTIFNFIMARCKPAIGQKNNNKKQANNTRRNTGELLGHFPSKIRFVFRSKTFPSNDSLTQKRSSVQDNNDVTK